MEKKKNTIKNIVLMFMLFSVMLVSANAVEQFKYSKLSETLLNQDPDPVEPGEYVELRFKVEKQGNEELKDIQYELVPEYPFSFDGSDTPIKKLGDWIGTSDEKEYYSLYYKLKVDKDALEGTYEVKLYQSSAANPNNKEVEFDIRVGESEEANLLIGQVKTNPAKLIADYDEGLIKVEVVNVGDGKAEEAIIELNLPEGFEESFGYSTRVNLGTIEAGSSKTAEFYVDTIEGLTKGNHKATLNIQYKEDEDKVEDEVKTIEQDFDISVFGRPEYKIVDTQIDLLSPGKDGKIRFKINNIGSRESDSTSVQIFKDSSQPFDFPEKSNFIGKMDVNNNGEVVFDVETDADAEAKEYKLKIQIRSIVDGDVLTEDETISVVVDSAPKAKPGESLTMRFGIYGIMILVGLGIGLKAGKGKNHKI